MTPDVAIDVLPAVPHITKRASNCRCCACPAHLKMYKIGGKDTAYRAELFCVRRLEHPSHIKAYIDTGELWTPEIQARHIDRMIDSWNAENMD